MNNEEMKNDKVKNEKINKSEATKAKRVTTGAARSFKLGSNAVVMIIAVVVIAVVLNVLVSFVDVSVDLTPNQLYTLSETNKEFLDGVKDSKIEIIGLFDETALPNTDYSSVIRLLSEYSAYDNITVEYVDPDKNPGYITEKAKDLSPSAGDFIVICGERRRLVSSSSLFNQDTSTLGVTYNYSMKAENAISGAINYVTTSDVPTIYYLQGHGEISLEDNYTMIVSYLDFNNFRVQPLNLLSEDDVPEDAELVFIISPTKDISDEEKLKIEKYLQKNYGKMMIFFDPQESDENFDNIQYLMGLYNIEVKNDKIAETSSYASTDSKYKFWTQPDATDIIDSTAASSIRLLIDGARSVNILKNYKVNLTTTALAATSKGAVGQPIIADDAENRGPLNIAVASQGMGAGTMIVFGDSDFMSDALYGSYQAYWTQGWTFFAHLLNWMVPEKNTLSITAKIINTERITISDDMAFRIAIVLVAVIPLIILAAGVVVWLRRRHK